MSTMSAHGQGRITLEAKVTRADGTVEDLGVIADSAAGTIVRHQSRLGALLSKIRRS